MNRRKKSILVDAHILDKEAQGLGTYIKGVYNAFIDLYGDKYNVYIAANNTDLLASSFPKVNPESILKLKQCSSLERLTRVLPNLIRKHKIDFAHFQQITPLIKNCRFIVTIHDLLFNDFPEKFSLSYKVSRNILFRYSFRISDLRLTVSEYSKDAIKRHYNFEDVYITPNGVSNNFFEPYSKAESIDYVFKKYGVRNYILYVSRIEERKNHLMLLKAYRDMKLFKKGFSLVFVGRNDIPVNSLEAEISSLTAEERSNFLWLQYVDDNDLLEIYRAAFLFVYPSAAEGFGIPPIEAAALHINTLCSNVTAMQDFSFFGQNHFDPNNYTVFLKTLDYSLNNEPSKEELEKRSNLIKEKYNWIASAKLLYSLIEDNS